MDERYLVLGLGMLNAAAAAVLAFGDAIPLYARAGLAAVAAASGFGLSYLHTRVYNARVVPHG